MGATSWLFSAVAGAPLPFSRRIPQPNRRTPPIGMFTIRGCRTWKLFGKKGGRAARVVEGLPG